MIVVDINPVAASIGPLSIRWYGLMYVVGIAAGLLVAFPYARSRGLSQIQLEKVVIWSVPVGLVGARLYYVLQQPLGQYVAEPWRIMALWEGGMAFYGAIFAVVLVLLVAGWRLKMSIAKLLDVAALFGVVGQFFGRIGNFINGDVIGYPTGLPWGVVYANPGSFPPRHDIAYHPAAAYEALVNVALFGLLWPLRKRLEAGTLFFLYVVGYSVGQVIVFFWRDNVVVFLGLKQAQLTAIVVLAAATAAFVALSRLRRSLPPA
ncbi:MAG: prolipoprotein diacylglyceryl transferase [Chloroflexi bacterium]|nr:prolipoprotein diacylglyceryl transferase [Chloroflexota bacterium]